jgi:predicted HTH domain antitoxin
MQLVINIPDELFLNINESKQNLISIAKQKLALELYKSHKISISQGAKLLEMDIYAFMKLLSQHQIPAIDDYDIALELSATKER